MCAADVMRRKHPDSQIKPKRDDDECLGYVPSNISFQFVGRGVNIYSTGLGVRDAEA